MCVYVLNDDYNSERDIYVLYCTMSIVLHAYTLQNPISA